MQLTPGAVVNIMHGRGPKPGQEPFRMQVLGTKAINGDGGQQRLKLLVSDGVNAVSVIGASGVHYGNMADNVVVDVTETMLTQPQGKKRHIVVLGLHVVGAWHEQIGQPTTLAMKDIDAQQQHQQRQQHQQPPMAQSTPMYGAPVGHPTYGVPPQQQPNMYGVPPQQQQPNMYGVQPPQQHNPYGVQQQPQQQPPQQHNPYASNNAGPIARNEGHANILPINSLNSYQNRWTIKARVTSKSDIRRYSNARGEGKFFSFDLLDSQNGEIRAVAWNDQCDRFFDQVEQGRVYFISKASLRNKRGNYNQLRHQFEIHLETNSLVEPAADDHQIKNASFNFQTIATLEDAPRGAVVDVIGVVESIDEPGSITRKDGSEAHKRDLRMKDASNCSINLTLWDKYCGDPGERIKAEIAAGRNPILACKGVRVGDFGGKNISTVSATQLVLDPNEVQETGALREWYAQKGKSMNAQALSMQGGGGKRQEWRVTMKQIRSEGIGMAEPAWVQALVSVSYVNPERFSYPACKLDYNGRPCNKKVTQSDEPGAQGWFCERCNATNDAPDHRYILSIKGMDHCGESWMTAFQESAPSITGIGANELVELKQEEERSENPVFSRKVKTFPWQTFLMTLKCTQERYQDEEKLRINVMRVAPIDFKAETRWTLDAIKRIENGQPAYPKPESKMGAGTGAGAGAGMGGGLKSAGGGMMMGGQQQGIQAVYGNNQNNAYQNNNNNAYNNQGNFGQAFL